ncbi:UNVERIFIED_CONTAM: hypothetical protein Slati_3801400 [Sesamum latifolium]|uniref:BED-type domain-containing protein n=1 Tax=Sesamum latifolium TaxID=2727402 RepID=A0AAW2U619_9LAMI
MAPKLDNGWEHATPVGGDRKKCKCNYCGKVVHGGITRLKQHIAHVSENIEACSRVPSEIRKMDDDDIDEHGMSALERKQLKQAMAESRYMGHVEEEIRRNPSRGAGFYGGSSKGSTSGAKRGISHSYGVKSSVEMLFTGFDPHMFPSGKRTIKGMLSKEGMKKIEVRRGVKEVIKRLEPDLIVQANAMNEIRLFVEKLGEFGSPLARQAVSTSLPDDDASLPLSRWFVQRSSKGKGKHVSSKEKGKQVTFKDKRAQVSSSGKDKHILHCSSTQNSSTQNDSDDETTEDDDNDDDDGDDDDDGGNDGGGNVHKDTQQSHGMTWAEGDENYYATQDTDHGYRPKLRMSVPIQFD